MSITERMQLIVDELYSGNKAGFAKAIGLAPTSISNYLSKGRASKPSSDILESIVNNIPEINSDWLITGKGKMLKTRSINIAGHGNIANTGTISGTLIGGNNNDSSDNDGKRIKELENKIKELQNRIKELNNDKTMLQDFINFLQNKDKK